MHEPIKVKFSNNTSKWQMGFNSAFKGLNKLTTDYFPHVIKPSCILSDHGTQFTSPMWKKKLSELDVTVRYSPIRHLESNPVERVMRETGKYCKIYCYTTQKKWPELESWLNTTISGSTGFTPVELMFNDIRPDIFSKILNKTKEQQPNNEELQDKISLADLTLKKKATKRERRKQLGSTRWEPELN
jgi:hypothetical protein